MLSAGTVGGVNFKCDLFQMNVDIFITCHQFPRESQRVESWGCQTGQKKRQKAPIGLLLQPLAPYNSALVPGLLWATF